MTCVKNVFLNSKQVKELLGLTCEKCYDENKGEETKKELLGKYHRYNICEWNNINGDMKLTYKKEYWKIVEVYPFHGTVMLEHEGYKRLMNIDDLKLN